MKSLETSEKKPYKPSQQLTDKGFMEAFERRWLGETIGKDDNGKLEIFGWLLGDLCLRILEAQVVQGGQRQMCLIELSLKQAGTGETLAIIYDGWIEIGMSVTFTNPPEGAVVVGQRVATGPGSGSK